MKEKRLLKLLLQKKSTIIENTLKLIPKAMQGDKVEREFFVKNVKGDVDYFVHKGQPILPQECFFRLGENESLDEEDFGYDSQPEMWEDEVFIHLCYEDRVEDSLNVKIEYLKLKLKINNQAT